MQKTLDFSAAIFDLDGTLLDTLSEIATACNAALCASGYPEHGIDAYRQFVGNGAKTLALRALPEDQRNAQEQEKLFALIVKEFELHQNRIARPYEGIPEILKNFSTCGKKIAVLSNKPEKYTKIAVEKLLPSISFFAVCGGREDTPLKPEPDSALRLADEMGVLPAETIFVGDSNVDIRTALNSGMIPVGAGWGFRGSEELIKAGASIVLNSPKELEKLL